MDTNNRIDIDIHGESRRECWRERAINFILRDRLYNLLTETGIELDEPADEASSVVSELIIKYDEGGSDNGSTNS